MSALRHRISKLFNPSEDSGAESTASTRALCGSEDTAVSRVSQDSGYRSAAAGKDGDGSSKMEAAADESPRTLKKAASTTFQAFSNSLRSRTQLFYAGSTLTGSPSTSGKSSPEKSRESSETESPSRKRFGQGPRLIMENTFSTPDKGKENSHLTSAQSVFTPKQTRPPSALWASIKKRTGNSPHSNKGITSEDLGLSSSPTIMVDEFAPSIDVEIPDHLLSVSQHLQRQATRRVKAGQPESPSKESSGYIVHESMLSSAQLLSTPNRQDGAGAVNDYLSLRSLDQNSNAGSPTERLNLSNIDRSHSNGQHVVDGSSGQKNRFLILNTPLRIALPPSPKEITPSQPQTPILRRGRGLQHGLIKLTDRYESPENVIVHHTRHDDFEFSHSKGSSGILEGSPLTTPEKPSMGSKSAWDEARADRNHRYSSVTSEELDTASDTDSDPDLKLVRSPGRGDRQSFEKPTAIGSASSSYGSSRPTGDLRYAVEANERSSGETYDESHSFDKPTAIGSAVSLQGVDRPAGDLRFAVEAIERNSGEIYDQSLASSSENISQAPALIGSNLPRTVEAVRRVSNTISENTENRSQVSPDLAEKPVPNAGGIAPLPAKGTDSVYGTGLAHVAQIMRESKRSSESTVTVETDPFLGSGQNRLQEKVQRVMTPVPEDHASTGQANSLGISSPSSSSYSDCTNESCALTTHDLLCYAPSPWPTVHVRTSPSPEKPHATNLNPCEPNRDMDNVYFDLESQVKHYKQSPWSNLIFDKDINMKHTAEPLTPEAQAGAEETQVKPTAEPLSVEAADPGPSTITLPASTFLKCDTNELLRQKEKFDPKPTRSRRRPQTKETSDHEFPSKEVERDFNAARLPAFGNTLPQITYSPPQGRKAHSKARRSVRHRQPLGVGSGNDRKPYTYSQVVKGDTLVPLPLSLKEVDEFNRHLRTVGNSDKENSGAGRGKGVWWAKEDELIGYADPQTPLSQRTDTTTSLDRESSKGDGPLKSKASSAPAFQVRNFEIREDDGFEIQETGIDAQKEKIWKILEQYPYVEILDSEDNPLPMTPEVQRTFQKLLAGVTPAAHDGGAVQEWGEEEKRAVAEHLMHVVHDLEEQTREEEDAGDEMKEKALAKYLMRTVYELEEEAQSDEVEEGESQEVELGSEREDEEGAIE
ncbi:eukaryotic translation initiation factor 4 gamma [Physcia stellaris]|nr:eukaryotic translation initiation factor 4 gamma [Physcia stellaris]